MAKHQARKTTSVARRRKLTNMRPDKINPKYLKLLKFSNKIEKLLPKDRRARLEDYEIKAAIQAIDCGAIQNGAPKIRRVSK